MSSTAIGLQYSSRTPPPPGISAPIPEVPLWKIATSEDEAWSVLEGELLFRVDTKTAGAPAGAFVFVPRGTRHCFQIIGEQPAKILVLFTPAGLERFVDRFATLPALTRAPF